MAVGKAATTIGHRTGRVQPRLNVFLSYIYIFLRYFLVLSCFASPPVLDCGRPTGSSDSSNVPGENVSEAAQVTDGRHADDRRWSAPQPGRRNRLSAASRRGHFGPTAGKGIPGHANKNFERDETYTRGTAARIMEPTLFISFSNASVFAGCVCCRVL